MKKILLLSAIIITAFTACTKLNDTGHHDRLTNLLLGKDTLNMYVGQVRYLPVTTTPVTYNTDSLVFKSSDTSVLTFSTKGILTAKKVGTSTISVSNLTNTI